MVLIKTLMPGNAHYFLTKYLDWMRWYNEDIFKWLELHFEFKRYQMDFGAYHELL